MGFETKTIRIAMNGITGRMGYRQHLLRSILPIRDAGRHHAARRHPRPGRADPGRAATRTSSASWPSCTASRDWTTDLDAAIADPRVDIYLRRLHDQPARAPALKKAIAAGKHIYTEKPTAESLEEAIELAAHRPGSRRHHRRRARQALPAGSGEAAPAGRRRLLRPHPLAPRRVRLLGVRGRRPARPAPELELPQRRRRRHDHRHVLPLELRARGHLRQGQDASTPRPPPTSRRAGTRAASEYAATADDAAYGIFELETPAAIIVAQINSSWAVRVYRDELVEFQVDGTHGSAVAGLIKCVAQQRAHTPKPVWNPDLPITESFREPVAGGARQRRVRQRLQAAVGGVPPRRRRRPRRTASTCSPPPAACSSPSSGLSPPPRAAPSRSRRSRCD